MLGLTASSHSYSTIIYGKPAHFRRGYVVWYLINTLLFHTEVSKLCLNSENRGENWMKKKNLNMFQQPLPLSLIPFCRANVSLQPVEFLWTLQSHKGSGFCPHDTVFPSAPLLEDGWGCFPFLHSCCCFSQEVNCRVLIIVSLYVRSPFFSRLFSDLSEVWQ